MPEPITLTITAVSLTKSRLEIELEPGRILQLLSSMMMGSEAERPSAVQPKKRGRPVRVVAAVAQVERKCAFCSNPFSTKFSGTRYCGQRCKERAHALQAKSTGNGASEVSA